MTLYLKYTNSLSRNLRSASESQPDDDFLDATHHLHVGTALTQARDRGQDRARSTLLSSTFALPKKWPQNSPDPLTRDWYNPGNFRVM